MTKRNKRVLVISVVAFAALLTFLIALFLPSPAPEPDNGPEYVSPEVEQPEPSSSMPPDSSSTPESVPTVEPIKHRIVGLWEFPPEDMEGMEFKVYYDFQPDGTLLRKRYYFDTGEWKTTMYNYSFSSWKGQEIIECEYLPKEDRYMARFSVKGGREYLDLVTVDGSYTFTHVARVNESEG